MPTPFVQVDAFTATPFAGNPAAVLVLDDAAEAGWMQLVAREMNLSETAFLHRAGEGFALRWFTPATEVDLCGHATLASAHVLFTDGWVGDADRVRFTTRSGELRAGRVGDRIELDFPLLRPRPVAPPPGLEAALGTAAEALGEGGGDLLVEVASEETVRRLEPDMAALRRLPFRGVIVTAASGDTRVDFVSRFFGPAVGVDEDPVTGSAHCVLGPYWQGRLGRDRLRGYQASARGGEVEVEVAGDRALLRGQAVTVLRGELLP